MANTDYCPNCGADLNPDPRTIYTFNKWATPIFVVIISFMLLGLDYINSVDPNTPAIEWAGWAIAGLWIFFLSVQFLRSSPNYGWLIVPIAGIMFSIFLFILDRATEPNENFLGLDWALYVILPVFTFTVAFPLIARIARVQPSHQDQLEYLVDSLVEEEANGS